MAEKAPKADDPSVDYLLIGHVCVDRQANGRFTLGGTATYAALAARNQGARVGIHTSASYEPGLVDTLFGATIARIPAEYTTAFRNEYADGRRKQWVESTAERLTYEQLLPEWRNTPLVHLAPICGELDATLVEKFPKSLVGVTPQGWVRTWEDDNAVAITPWDEAERVLPRADAVILSEDDLVTAEVLPGWAKIAKLLVVTRGANGADVYKQGEAEPYHSPAFKPAKVVDPTGAGDVFAASYLWHLKETGDWQRAADWANCVASFVVEKAGSQSVPKLEDIEKRWQKGQGKRA
jgi:hypothetical protein